MAKPNPMKSAVQTFRALNPKHRFMSRIIKVEPKVTPKAKKEDGSVCGEMYLYDAIGADWYGGIGAKDVVAAIKGIEEAGAKTLNVYINSPGGDVFEGTAIYTAISRFSGKKHCFVDGLAASAASFIAMVGDEITTAFNAMWMVHNPWGVVIGNANDMRETSKTLDLIGGTMVDTYAKRTGQSKEDIQSWLDAETWMTAEVAKERGFTDDVTEEDDTEAAACACKCDACTGGNCADCSCESGDMCESCKSGACPGCEDTSASAATTSVLARFNNTPKHLKPAAKDMINSMEERLKMRTRASPPTRSTPGQPGKK